MAVDKIVGRLPAHQADIDEVMAYDWRNSDQVELIQRYFAGLVEQAHDDEIHRAWRDFTSTIADLGPDNFERMGRDAVDDLLVRRQSH
ncbi:hypothetical protein B5V01_08125 [Mesorhizobium erdmanii]|uniref:Uncharacterized protein n=2 Tax=Mesorhizobium TaxID=68287 RepID=A0A3M9X2Z2_9HYPH|nr:MULTISPECIES: hypothetical protein [Mesorhizobium]RNJ42399.1 hypothetical protein DNR46_28800 [Mesorhizobium japonicum]RXT47919.1 hypothetical protein B5V01_08125 [Mesorhizobium erdmanii]